MITSADSSTFAYPSQNHHDCSSLSHTHATILFEANTNAKEVQERLGHSEITMTLDIYTHITKETEKGTVEKLINHISF